MTAQLALGIHLRDTATFDNFIPGANRELHAWLRTHAAGTADRPGYIWGGAGLGKTHLLHASCHLANAAERTAFYLPLEQCHDFPPDVLEGGADFDLLALDNIDAVVGRRDWEEALFSLYNRVRDRQTTQLLFTAGCAPAALSCILPDLQSRLGWGLVFQLQRIADRERIDALRLRARERGMELGDDVLAYLLRRFPRDMPALFQLLERLDQASLAAQRRITIPFVRELQGW